MAVYNGAIGGGLRRREHSPLCKGRININIKGPVFEQNSHKKNKDDFYMTLKHTFLLNHPLNLLNVIMQTYVIFVMLSTKV